MGDYQHETGTMIGRGGTEIFIQSWEASHPGAALVLSHGLGEHSGRYGHIVERLKGKHVSIFAMDHRGHGRSAGKRGHVLHFDEYVDDLGFYINIVIDQKPDLPVFLLGHSMGGLIAMSYALRSQEKLSGLILSSAALLSSVEAPPVKVAVGNFLAKYLPGIQVSNELDANYISHDRDTVKKYLSDPLNHDRISLRWYTEFMRAGKECLARADELKIPLLLFHGTEDRIIDFSGTIQVFNAASSRDKKQHLFEGLYHEAMNEVEHERVKVLDVVGNWILARMGKAKKTKPAKATQPKKKKSPVKKKVPGGPGAPHKTA